MASSAETYLHTPKAAPALHFPPGASAKVQIIDTTAKIYAPVATFMSPVFPGHELLRAPAFSFLVEQPSSGRKLLFDLGTRVDWQNFAPAVMELISKPPWKIEVEKSVAQILQENGVDAAGGAIEAIVWSHWHFDHTGDPSTFPGSTSLICGPGMKESFLPGYPPNEKSPLLETDVEGREVIEVDFEGSNALAFGRYRAVDYFKDGSFYLLDAPGHAIGHICGLARVTSTKDGDKEDTFIFMGADTAHHGAEYRPTEYLPLPKEINPSPYLSHYPSSCPGHIFESIHPHGKGTEPFYHLNANVPPSLEQAEESCGKMQEFDAADNVFVIIAHDESLLDERVGIEWFPHGTLKNWREKDCDRKARWVFLRDLTQAVEEKAKEGKAKV